jgi:hypothetical protein
MALTAKEVLRSIRRRNRNKCGSIYLVMATTQWDHIPVYAGGLKECVDFIAGGWTPIRLLDLECRLAGLGYREDWAVWQYLDLFRLGHNGFAQVGMWRRESLL